MPSFYGPYTSKYRFWPGTLLLSRLVILFAFAFYSPDSIIFKLLTMATALLVSWIRMVIGKISAVPLKRRKLLNYLELFLLLNLSVFAGLSIYVSGRLSKKGQQGLAVAMVGSVLALSFVILGYLTFSNCKAVRKLIPANMVKRKDTSGEPQNPSPKQEDISTKTTHSLVEITECSTPNDQLREPLLTNNAHESGSIQTTT